MRDHLVAALIYDDLCTFEFGCVVEIFGIRRAELDVEWYRFAACSMDRGPVHAAGGVTIASHAGLSLLDRAQTIIVPGWRDIGEAPPPAVSKKLRAAHERGARICSICGGAFVLAAAGLLDGRRATTHWRFAGELARRYPKVHVQPNMLYVEDGALVTSAGSAAGLDMMLHLVRSDHGPRVANAVAQRLVIAPHRDGGQAQFVPRALPGTDTNRVSALMQWVRGHLKKPHTVPSLASRAAMSPRTLLRAFRDATGMAPYEWLLKERVAYAKDLLEVSATPLARIAETAGFGSDEAFRKHFRRIVGTSPGAYRRRFAR
ncbi:MAG TPA: transcriptional regulator FtrA [Burkholderiaceae bacterium]|nr:transcriptional regulator FtrA [Burkholderiaceae bacterium]